MHRRIVETQRLIADMPLRSCKELSCFAEASADISHCFGDGKYRCNSAISAAVQELPGIVFLSRGKAHVRLTRSLLVRAWRAASGRVGRPRASQTASHGNSVEPDVDRRSPNLRDGEVSHPAPVVTELVSRGTGWPMHRHGRPGTCSTSRSRLAGRSNAAAACSAARSTGPGAQARRELPDCLGRFGNPRCRHSTIGHPGPMGSKPDAVPAWEAGPAIPPRPGRDVTRRGRSSPSERSFQPS